MNGLGQRHPQKRQQGEQEDADSGGELQALLGKNGMFIPGQPEMLLGNPGSGRNRQKGHGLLPDVVIVAQQHLGQQRIMFFADLSAQICTRNGENLTGGKFPAESFLRILQLLA